MIKRIINSILIILALLTAGCKKQTTDTIDLSGEWHFRMDPDDLGIKANWWLTPFDETVTLPGTMAQNGKGEDVGIHTHWTGGIVDSAWFFEEKYAKYRQPGNIKIPFWLQPEKHYIGAAWYRKEVIIPDDWSDKSIELRMERCHWETRVWIDNHEVGMRNSLATPHYYDLTEFLKPGIHNLTIRVDNRIKDINPGPNAHSISDHTQSNWNGIAGEITLKKRPLVMIENIRIIPDIQRQSVDAYIKIKKHTGSDVKGKIQVSVNSKNEPAKQNRDPVQKSVSIKGSSQIIKIAYPLGPEILLWDEFNPSLYELNAKIETTHGSDSQQTTFGIREAKTSGRRIMVNDRPVFLRGTLECAIFPKSQHPATDVKTWSRIFDICRSHGLNHMRFHSWCPPEAAFIAADSKGFYLQVECSSWANQGTQIGDGDPIDQFIFEESTRIIQEYGNHPSFLMLAYGNEPAGLNQEKWLGGLVNYWKETDGQRIYTGAAGWPAIPENNYHNLPAPRIQGWGEELRSVINAVPPGTGFDWDEKIKNFTVPVISHEIGQWCVYPNFREIEKYDGVLKSKNFEIFRETLEENHMGHLADSFLLASGKLQALCYKAEIEAALRTRELGGFQLLELHDFPGQGTALVGILDAFWDEKGYISPGEFSGFCNETVALARMDKRIYTNNETFQADIEITHFGPKPLKGQEVRWNIKDLEGETLFEGAFPAKDIEWGGAQYIGPISRPLSRFINPQKLTLNVRVDRFENNWDFWVYPADHPSIEKSNVRIVQQLDNETINFLESGGRVLLTAKRGSIAADKGGEIGVGFSSIFWNTAWTRGQKPHTLGILCNPGHPALSEFPSEYYSNWQWWDAMSHAQAIQLDEFPVALKPVVHIIDDWFQNRRLALILEAKVGNGKILVTGIDLLENADVRPEARQLLYSLEKYVSSDKFQPPVTLGVEELRSLQK